MEKGISTVGQGILLLLFGLVPFYANSAIQFPSGKVQFVPGELVVKVKTNAALSIQSADFVVKQAVESQLGKQAVQSIKTFKTNSAFKLVRLKDEVQLFSATEVLKKDEMIEYAEPNYIYWAEVDSPGEVRDEPPTNDPDFEKLWGMKNTGQEEPVREGSGREPAVGRPGADINVVPAWEAGIKGSRDVVVAIVDTGIDWDHPDLVENLYTNPGEAGDLANNGVDDDGNGFIDDVHGWNFINNSRNSDDDNDHGTHCAGTIGAVGDNAMGVVGVNHEVSVMPLKFLSAMGSGSLADAVEAINYGTMMKVDIMSNSWGGGPFAQALKDAITAAKDEGILFVAAAGNSSANNDVTAAYPANYDVDNVVSVAAATNRDGLAYFSSYGATKVHVAAPGFNVYSTIKDGGYESFSGTSMATPHVAGAAALMRSYNKDWSYSEIKDRLIRTSVQVMRLYNKTQSKGRINVWNAINNEVPDPLEYPQEDQWVAEAYDLESDHPYANDMNETYEISRDGAKFIRLKFKILDTEAGWDFVQIETADGEVLEKISGKYEGYVTGPVDADKVVIRLTSDGSVTSHGFELEEVQVIE